MSIQAVTNKLTQLEESLETLRELITVNETTKEHEPDHNLYCYFNYSIFPNNNTQGKHMIIGSFHIKNISSTTIKDPMILLTVDADSPCDFSGKYKTEHLDDEPYPFSWERMIVDDLDSQTHFCFKPLNKQELQPNELLSFENFQIKFHVDESIVVDGFTYLDQDNNGVPAVNTIQLHT